ncbi:phthiocerol/phthiodiolone dimycocerosyl transferase [Mycolicibacterium parafortuitum]|uniref:Phthiocerol/phthiodiolone dimycocerosyl transferase n=1 Tax=Mycolicibacterium parafortuitum TaxID=39692 RepID=A0A7I7U753_MYCPF|nr:phthiocerol/phthiodiolone dimycocerosyl transferase [Mycolicibacterium parafortuitum]BBY77127.1 phthiocerol/phthiodiolone dimycocerosyl transferase [Mycolicibacterium parafortuitum]
MFPSSGIRKLARSEEMFAETQNFVGLAAHVHGTIDVDALSEAFDALVQAHPVLNGHLEQDPDGKWEIVLDDLMHQGLEVVELTGDAEAPPLLFDQTAALTHLRLTRRDDETHLTLYIHHSLADGHHQFSLVEELFSTYTDLVTTGTARPVQPAPVPVSLEQILSDRAVEKKPRSGLERLLAAMFAYDVPPSRRAPAESNPVFPQRVPMEFCKLSEEQTENIIAFCRANKLGLNSLLSGAILMAEWQLRQTPNIPVPYVYPVDLRYLLSPPVSATEATNPVGIATYLAEISADTDVVDLARDINDTFKKDIAEGVIQQSFLHFSPQYVGNPPGLPDVVMFTDNGIVPPMRMPPEMELAASHGELYFAVGAGIEIYTSKIFAGRLMIEYHSHGPEPEKSVQAIETLLEGIAARQAAVRVS